MSLLIAPQYYLGGVTPPPAVCEAHPVMSLSIRRLFAFCLAEPAEGQTLIGAKRRLAAITAVAEAMANQ
jgi:hypothetical protein